VTEEPAAPLALRAEGLTKVFTYRGVPRAVLNGVDLNVVKGEVVAVIGPSGTGKSTLLNILGVLDRPDAGTLEIAGRFCQSLSSSQAAKTRAGSIGFIFQAMNLIPHLTVQTNVEVGAWPVTRTSQRDRILELLTDVGVGEHAGRRAAELSLGEQQRVALVRALVKNPAVILADEPTGSLDQENGLLVMRMLRRAADEGSGVVVVTHSTEVAAQADRVCELVEGSLSSRLG
jgi:ABC-type lipoprotein export system ATPase subunit